jgi:DNA-binding winged helix-turn-helix (wHTH) protein/tetratricopeptide (TPR) repeat protein
MHESNSALPGSDRPGISFASFRLEADGILFCGETPVHLPPKELAALRLLLANAGRIVTPAQLRDALWGDVHVTADSVPKCLSSLRARLEPEDCIQTIYKRGYRFTAEVRTRGAGPGGALPRLAILPFGTSFGVPDYLGSATAEETIAQLSGARPVTALVLAQDSVFTLARRGLTALETGQMLKADLVLSGSLRALPMHYRLRVEMIRVEDGTQLWVEDLLVERRRIAALETELARRLLKRLSSQSAADWSSSPSRNAGATPDLPPTEPAVKTPTSRRLPCEGLAISAVAEGAPKTGIEHHEAYEIFQRAHHEWQTLERHRMQDGLQHLLRATELDPSLIAARVDLVNLCVAQASYGFMSPAVAADIVHRAAESISTVADPAERRSSLSPELPGAEAASPSRWGIQPGLHHVVHHQADHADAVLPALGWIQFHVDRDLPAALSAFSLSAHLPHDAWTTRARSMFALSRHRFGEAIELLRAALHLDPFAPWLHARLAWALHLSGEASSSVDQIRHALSQFPEHGGTSLYGAVILAYNGEPDRAVETAQGLAQRLPYFDLANEVLAYAQACAGRTDEARAVLERLQWLGRERFLLRAFTPAVYLVLGEQDAALAELATSNDLRCPWFFQMLADPRLKPLESRPEFLEMRDLLTRMEAEGARNDQLYA